ncbi:MAG TPA: restriction endonuclease [Polyangiaceae bacterium]|nr:restriction endonuclease [Polyangiaceae bacterium]
MVGKRQKGPEFLRFVAPIVETLKELGSSGTASEVTDRVLERLKVTEAEQEATTSNGQSRVRNQIGWARFYLVKANLLDASQRGVWALTEVGRNSKLDPESVYSLFKNVQKQFPRKTSEESENDGHADGADEAPSPSAEAIDHRPRLLEVLRSLPASGFERICQRLLRESGFQQVTVTGRSGDGGIDGHGILEVNPLVTFKVLFQCKRYKGDHSVTPSQVRDFRGAMQGRADKGLVLTTGTFTSEARKEATRDGVPPIELVDGEKLVLMFERAELGLRPVQTYELDEGFFDEFRK